METSFKIVLAEAGNKDVKITLLHICCSHTMKFNMHMIDTIIKKGAGRAIFEMRDYNEALCTSCGVQTLEVLTDLVEAGCMAMTSKFTTNKVRVAFRFIEKSINQYYHAAEEVDELEKESEAPTQDEEDANYPAEDNGSKEDAYLGAQEGIGRSDESSVSGYWAKQLSKTKETISRTKLPEILPSHNKSIAQHTSNTLQAKSVLTVTLSKNLAIGDLSTENTKSKIPALFGQVACMLKLKKWKSCSDNKTQPKCS